MPSLKPSTQSLARIAYLIDPDSEQNDGIVANEIEALRANGYQVEIVSLAVFRHFTERDLPDVGFNRNKAFISPLALWDNLVAFLFAGLTNYRFLYQLAQKAGLAHDFRGFLFFCVHAFQLKRSGIYRLHAYRAREEATAALILSKLTGLPFSFTIHDDDIFLAEPDLLQKLTEANFILALSDYNKNYLIEQFGPQIAPKIHTVYPFINFSELPLRPDPAVDKTLQILAVGPLLSHRGFIYLVEACRILQTYNIPFHCHIVGREAPVKSPLKPWDRQRSEAVYEQDVNVTINAYSLQHAITVCHSASDSQLAALFEQASVFVLPTVIAHDGRRESLPYDLVEAMARGVPVIASQLGGLRELFGDESGMLVPPHNPDALARALTQLSQMAAEERRKMGRWGRCVVEAKLNSQRRCAKLKGLFEERKPKRLAHPYLYSVYKLIRNIA